MTRNQISPNVPPEQPDAASNNCPPSARSTDGFFGVVSIQVTADTLFTMMRYLGVTLGSLDPGHSSMSVSGVFLPSDSSQTAPPERSGGSSGDSSGDRWLQTDDTLSPEERKKIKNHPFREVVRNFSPRLQYKLLGIDPQTYWRTPEVAQTLRYFRHEPCEVADTPLPGEGAEKPALLAEKNRPAATIHDSLTVFDTREELPFTAIPVVCYAKDPSGNVTFGHSRENIDKIPPKPPRAPKEEEAWDEELSPGEQFLKKQGFSFERRNVRLAVRMACEADTPVVLVGPTGVGKSRLAHLLHRCYYKLEEAKSDNTHPFIEVNCAGVKRELAESVLFGHHKGAFSGASVDHRGYLRQADNGSFFLDEMEELPTEVQASLLTTFDAAAPLVHTFYPLGAEQKESSRFRLIVATNVEPETLIAEKKLREDFNSRLGPVVIHLPAIDGDPSRLLAMFRTIEEEMKKKGKSFEITEPARKRLEAWLTSSSGQWSGNRRDLVHCVNTLSSMAKINGKAIQPNNIDQLILLMNDYWHGPNVTNGQVCVDADTAEPVALELKYKRFFEQVYGQKIAEKISPNDYNECFELTVVNFLCGSANRAGECYFGKNQGSNPSKKMTDRLVKMNLLDQAKNYKKLFVTIDENLKQGIRDPRNFDFFSWVVKNRPSDANSTAYPNTYPDVNSDA